MELNVTGTVLEVLPSPLQRAYETISLGGSRKPKHNGQRPVVIANNVVQIQFRLLFIAILVSEHSFEDVIIIQLKANSRLVEAHRVRLKGFKVDLGVDIWVDCLRL